MIQKLNARILVMCVLGALALTSIVSGQSHVRRQRGQVASICGNPKVSCKTTALFEPHDLKFRVPKDAVIIDTAPFYAIILQSRTASPDACDDFIPETERLAAQALFPDHKVFSSRCTDPESLRYEDITRGKSKNLSDSYRILAVYAGSTLAEAKSFLETVKATGKYPGASLRRMRTGFNGT